MSKIRVVQTNSVLMKIIFIVAAVVVFYLTMNGFVHTEIIKDHKEVDGKIVKMDTVTPANKEEKPYYVYTFVYYVDNNRYMATQKMKAPDFYAEQNVKVYHSIKNPQKAKISNNSRTGATISAILLILPILFTINQAITNRRLKKFMSETKADREEAWQTGRWQKQNKHDQQ